MHLLQGWNEVRSVRRLPRREVDCQGAACLIHHQMQFAGEAAARTTKSFVTFGIAGPSGAAVGVDVGGVEGDAVPVDLVAFQALEYMQDTRSGAVSLPFDEAGVASAPGAIAGWNFAPGGAVVEAPEDDFENLSVVPEGTPDSWVGGIPPSRQTLQRLEFS